MFNTHIIQALLNMADPNPASHLEIVAQQNMSANGKEIILIAK